MTAVLQTPAAPPSRLRRFGAASAPGTSLWLKGAAVFLVLLGTGLCLAHYLSFRSLWLDEACVAQNLRERTLSGLFSPLGYGQMFPSLYLALIWILKASVGYELWSLRLLPFLFGAGALVLWSALLWREFEGSSRGLGAFAAVALFLTNYTVYYYAGELKQYSADLFFSGFALWHLRRRVLPDLGGRTGRWTVSALAWTAPILVSFPYVLVIAALGAAFIAPALLRGDRRVWGRAAGLAAFALGFLALAWQIDLKTSGEHDFANYWAPWFISGESLPAWLQSLGTGVVRVTGMWWLTRSAALIVLPLIAAGLLHAAGRALAGRPFSAAAAAAGILLAELLLLAALRRYPLECGRTALFFFPYAVILAAHGLRALLSSESRVQVLAGRLGVALVLAMTLGRKLPSAVRHFTAEPHWQDLNPAFEVLSGPRLSDTVLYSAGSVHQIQAAPHLPAGLALVSQYSASPEILEGSFYYLMASAGDELDELKKTLGPSAAAEIRPVAPHLYFRGRPSA